jgi:peptide-methionine (R)-S-oxide reductase
MSRLYAPLWVSLPITVVLVLSSSLGAWAQDPLANAPLAPGSVIPNDGSEQKNSNSTAKTDTKAQAKPEPEFVVKTEAEWRKILTRTQYAVTRQKWTEPAFSGKYATGHYSGTFVCVCCDAALFAADTKFESGTGWPSFDRPANAKAIQTAWDYSAIEPRVEVMCRRCRAHLGHVFDDGPTRTGLRYCINSAAIKLQPLDSELKPRTASTKGSSKAKVKSKPGTKSVPKSTQPDDSPSQTDTGRPGAPTDTKGTSTSPSS